MGVGVGVGGWGLQGTQEQVSLPSAVWVTLKSALGPGPSYYMPSLLDLPSFYHSPSHGSQDRVAAAS